MVRALILSARLRSVARSAVAGQKAVHVTGFVEAANPNEPTTDGTVRFVSEGPGALLIVERASGARGASQWIRVGFGNDNPASGPHARTLDRRPPAEPRGPDNG